MRLVIEINLSTNTRVVTVAGDHRRAVLHPSIHKMADLLTAVSEIHGGEEVDCLLFADVAYLDE